MSSAVHEVVNPATEEIVTTVELTSLEQTDAAIERAARAFPAWRAVAPGDRGRLLRRFAELVDAHVEELAQLEVANSGHTIGNARWEAGNVRDVLTYYSAAPERASGRQIPVAGANPQPAIGMGKFQGTMMPTTPNGSRNVTSRPPATGIW